MIISFQHKDLEEFFYHDSVKGIDATHATKLRKF